MTDFAAWKRLYEQEITDYRNHYAKTGDYLGYFSVPRYKTAADIGVIIREYCSGQLCLDIGCGPLKRPVYMLPDMNFVGIDPDPGFQKRAFPFKKGMGEDIPFPDCHFGCVTIMTSLDHALDPDQVIAESHRVLKPGGYIFIWYTNKSGLDGHHLHFFSRAKIDKILVAHRFTVVEQRVCQRSSIHPETMLAIGKRVG